MTYALRDCEDPYRQRSYARNIFNFHWPIMGLFLIREFLGISERKCFCHKQYLFPRMKVLGVFILQLDVGVHFYFATPSEPNNLIIISM